MQVLNITLLNNSATEEKNTTSLLNQVDGVPCLSSGVFFSTSDKTNKHLLRRFESTITTCESRYSRRVYDSLIGNLGLTIQNKSRPQQTKREIKLFPRPFSRNTRFD